MILFILLPNQIYGGNTDNRIHRPGLSKKQKDIKFINDLILRFKMTEITIFDYLDTILFQLK